MLSAKSLLFKILRADVNLAIGSISLQCCLMISVDVSTQVLLLLIFCPRTEAISQDAKSAPCSVYLPE